MPTSRQLFGERALELAEVRLALLAEDLGDASCPRAARSRDRGRETSGRAARRRPARPSSCPRPAGRRGSRCGLRRISRRAGLRRAKGSHHSSVSSSPSESPPNFSSNASASTSASIASAMTPIAGTAVTSLRSATAARRLAGGDVHRAEGPHEGADRLHRDAHDERLAGRHAALEPAGAVGARAGRCPSAGASGRGLDLVVHLGAGARAPSRSPCRSRPPSPRESTSSPRRCRPSSLRSHETCEPSPTGSPSTTTSQMPPSVLPARFDASMQRDHRALGVGVERAQRRGVGGRVDVASAWRRDARASMPPRCTRWLPMRDAELARKRCADGAGGDARRGLARRGALEDVARVVAVVLEDPGEIGVAGPHARDGALAARRSRIVELVARRGVHDLLPVLPVAIADEHRDRTSRSFRRRARRRGTRRVALDLHAPPAAVALLAPRELGVRRRRRASGRPAGIPSRMLTRAWPVGFAGGGEANHSESCQRSSNAAIGDARHRAARAALAIASDNSVCARSVKRGWYHSAAQLAARRAVSGPLSAADSWSRAAPVSM